MNFEWDEIKHERNIIKHGVSFYHALKIFMNPTQDTLDTRKDYGEDRIIALGEYEEEVFIVIYTEREGKRRIISARTANKKERRTWHLSKLL